MKGMKSNKAFLKRLKITRNGKVVARKAGQNHFNAKESRRTQLKGRRTQGLPETTITSKVAQRYIKF
jgi:ribosomal protein L35